MTAAVGPAAHEATVDRAAWAISAEGLYRSFGPKPVLQGLDLRVGWGERMVLLGPNGSGKTTLIRILAALSRPAGGRAFIGGFDVVEDVEKVRPLLGVLCHQSYLYRDLSVQENLTFYGQMYRVPDLKERSAYLLERVGLAPHADSLTRTLSRGMLQRLALARAILHRPAVILLDEPDTGLDLQSSAVLRDLLRELAEEGCGILLTTHQVERASTFADRVAVLSRGRIVFQSDEPGGLDAESLAETYYRHAGR